MKNTIIINSLVMALSIVFIVYGCSKIQRQGVKDSVTVTIPVEYFKIGEILYPDYACPDTLIVIDLFEPGYLKNNPLVQNQSIAA